MVPQLAAQGVRVIAIDRVGFGRCVRVALNTANVPPHRAAPPHAYHTATTPLPHRRTERPLPPTLPPPPPLPFRERLASYLSETNEVDGGDGDGDGDGEDDDSSLGGQLGSLARGALVTGLR